MREFDFSGGTLQAASTFSTSVPITLSAAGSNGVLDTASSSLTLTGQISGSGGLIKAGTATLVLAGSNTYSGGTTIAGGTLMLSFSHSGTPRTNIINHATNASSLSLAGGVLAIQGSANSTNSQTFNGLIVNPGTRPSC